MTGGINFLNTVHSYTHSKRLTLGLKQRHLTSFGRYVQGVYTINIIQVNGRHPVYRPKLDKCLWAKGQTQGAAGCII